MDSSSKITIADLCRMSNADLARVMANGHPVDTGALKNTMYRGTSLGLPKIFDKLLWKTFRKTFVWDESRGVLRGWNVRLVQRGIDGPSEPMRKRNNEPLTFGHYHVCETKSHKIPRGYTNGVLLDYKTPPNTFFDMARFMMAPVIAVNPGDPTLLMGWEYVQLGPFTFPTPAYWPLELEGPVDEIVDYPA